MPGVHSVAEVLIFSVIGVCFIVLLEWYILGLSQRWTRPWVVRWFGVLQCLLDGGKLFLKSNALGELLICCLQFMLSLLLVGVFLSYSLLGGLLLLGLCTLGVYGVCVAQVNSYANISSFWVISVSISFDVVFSFFLILVLRDLCESSWFLESLVCYGLGLIEVGWTPFDLLEAESELVSGHTIESGGIRFTFLFLSEYLSFFWLRLIFLYFSRLSFSLLLVLLVIVLVWAVLPRLKFNQVLDMSWGVVNLVLFLFLIIG